MASAVLMLAEKGIEVDAIHRVRLLHFLFAQEEFHAYFWLAFIHLPTKNIHWLLQNFEGLYRAVKVGDFASHGE